MVGTALISVAVRFVARTGTVAWGWSFVLKGFPFSSLSQSKSESGVSKLGWCTPEMDGSYRLLEAIAFKR